MVFQQYNLWLNIGFGLILGLGPGPNLGFGQVLAWYGLGFDYCLGIGSIVGIGPILS